MSGLRAVQGALSRVKGNYGEALVGAIAAAGGLACYSPDLDLGFDRVVESTSGEMIRLQIKCTSSPLVEVAGCLRYGLEVEAYDRLRKPQAVPSYLVLIRTRESLQEWTAAMDWGYVLRRRAYYVSLTNAPPTPNVAQITVSVPLTNMITTRSLVSLVEGGA